MIFSRHFFRELILLLAITSTLLSACSTSDNKKDQKKSTNNTSKEFPEYTPYINGEPSSSSTYDEDQTEEDKYYQYEHEAGKYHQYEFESSWDPTPYNELREGLPPFDFDQDISDKSAFELRILRNSIPARYGYLFMKSDIRGYFEKYRWYRLLMEARWYGDCEYSGMQPAPPIEYTSEELAFMDKVSKLEAKRNSENYILTNGQKRANTKNIINAWQYRNLPEELMERLGKHGFAIVPNNNVQLFHVYESNDYSQTQNFVTTDLYLQLFHMQFSFMLRQLEEEKFIPILNEMLQGFLGEVNNQQAMVMDEEVKNALFYNGASYAIPLTLLDSGITHVPETYRSQVQKELDKIETSQADLSSILDAHKKYEFPYDQFKPRGHYTRTEPLKRYFRAMQWLQLAPYCLEKESDLKKAIVAAYILNNGKGKSGKSLLSLYEAILTPTTFLVGKPDNLSLLDICHILKAKNYTKIEEAVSSEAMSEILREMRTLAKEKNIIKPKVELTCPDKINFMPARFVLDNEILQEMIDVKRRPYPKGLDVMAAFGSKAAENILLDELGEQENWSEYIPNLSEMQRKYGQFENWDESVYAKWIEGLSEMLDPDERYPYFMQLPQWQKKNLNTALASWAELKHDAILYTEQIMAAECGGGGDCAPPPSPYVVGYVEPNVKYWQSAIDLLNLTRNLLQKHDLLDNRMDQQLSSLKETSTFLLTVSNKELKGEKLSDQEYRTIELIGSSVDDATRSILEINEWSEVSGPDKEIGIVADIYTNNQGEEAGILHEAVGYANDIYVLVEIEGHLYITKGATFSYYEFPMPLDKRLTDDEWQEMLRKNKVYPTPDWMDEIILDLNDDIRPETVEYIYSSGC
ncbi:DUF3160 domain-containing protein [Fulvivirga sediminis]|uniref:DUF3160 domain-containing protein n=1 Tax=Fulvivirga sediminis TaxID=2803949 RepID=A0A937FAF9_9BACT|nr:DUF3160 domain-containing protein [Fulvivirga sediminis]MBL3657270.1 DUF3160 domain-containing protein [Fulvivirga sediminis]